jgi:GNAT superfamily N-acetyltransferase
MLQVDPTNSDQVALIRELAWEYFVWGNSVSVRDYGFNFDIESMLQHFMDNLAKYTPAQKGRLYLLASGSTAIGLGGYRGLDATCAELKRLYIREEHRGQGIGRALVRELLENAHSDGYKKVRIESAQFMTHARSLYRSLGFVDAPLYVGIESPDEYLSIIYFMELELNKNKLSND